jgi:hypothetical protein
MKFNRKNIFRIIAGLIVFFLLAVWFVVGQPSWSKNNPVNLSVDVEKLKSHVKFLSIDSFPRNENNLVQLEKVASYIEESFRSSGLVVERQELRVRSKNYYNIIGHLNAGKGHKMIVGAHYDSCWSTPGADDNASGVAGLLELATLLVKAELPYEIEFVAYTLEEPPYFGSPAMGSAVHAKRLDEKKEKIDGVLVFEMIGYFSDINFSQKYPMPMLYLYYPFKGNFITVVGATNQMGFTKEVKIGMQGSTDLPVYSINAPTYLPGVDFSDHASYWRYDYQAVMITDTAFYRNEAYHKKEDTMDRLDFERMAKVVLSTYNYLKTRVLVEQ